MENMAGEERKQVVLFPFMAQGHIIPFLALALQIERCKSGYAITIVNTPRNIANLHPSLPCTSRIRLRSLPFCPAEHDLPPEAENTDSLSYTSVFRLVQASSSLKPSFRDLVAEIAAADRHAPICIIADLLFPWSVDVAREFDAKHALFSATGGFGCACYYSLQINPPPGLNIEFTISDFPQAGKFQANQLSVEMCTSDEISSSATEYVRRMLLRWSESDAFLFNTVEELDATGLDYFRHKFNKPAWAIGPVLLSSQGSPSLRDQGAVCRVWLDSKPSKSVLYVSFGSQSTPSPSQMKDLANALEASGQNFIWVVRPPIGYDINSDFRPEFLPNGFEERVGKRGLVVKKWAPQVAILSHRSTAAFLSHCGWNSVLEALIYGIPILGWPMGGDQFYNSKFLQEKIGVCLEVARGYGSEVGYEDLAHKMQMVVRGTKEGKELRRRAEDVMAIVKFAINDEQGRYGPSVNALNEFLHLC